MRYTWNYIVIKFLAMQLYPCLKGNGLNRLGTAWWHPMGNRVKNFTYGCSYASITTGIKGSFNGTKFVISGKFQPFMSFDAIIT